jgi:hypothetical protein
MPIIRVVENGPNITLTLDDGRRRSLRPGEEVEVSEAQAKRLLGSTPPTFELAKPAVKASAPEAPKPAAPKTAKPKTPKTKPAS